MEYFYIGLGGIFGALSRYGLSKWVGQRWQRDFPLATFLVNIAGSLVMGLLFAIFSQAGIEAGFLKNLTTTGFLGAFTTYSTFSYEIIRLIESGENGTAISYFLASLMVGLTAVYAGMVIGEAVSL